jgi:hypothetical protein
VNERIPIPHGIIGTMANCNHAPTAVPQLLYPETTAAEWLFPQEKATLHDAGESTLIVEPLYHL